MDDGLRVGDVTPEGRIITGITGAEGVDTAVDPAAPGFSTHLKRTKTGEIVNTGPVVGGKYCQTHNLVKDPSEKEFVALKCTNCPYHCLTKRKTPVD